MMKTLVSYALSTVVMFATVIAATMPSAMAAALTQKELQNQPISTSEKMLIKAATSSQIAQYDINPFVDRKRAMHSEDTRYTTPQPEQPVEDKQQPVKH